MLDIASFTTKQGREALGYFLTPRDSYRSPDLAPNVAAMQKEIDLASEAKLMPARIDVEKFLDLSLQREAKARIDGK